MVSAWKLLSFVIEVVKSIFHIRRKFRNNNVPELSSKNNIRKLIDRFKSGKNPKTSSKRVIHFQKSVGYKLQIVHEILAQNTWKICRRTGAISRYEPYFI